MPTLSADLDLNLEAALSALSELDDSLARTAENFASELSDAIQSVLGEADSITASVIVDPDVSAVEPAIDEAIGSAQLSLPLEADTSPAEAAITGLVAAADGETAVISVDADTSGAEESLAGLDDSLGSTSTAARSAGGEMRGAGEAVGAVSGAAALARGEVGGLGEVTTGLGIGSVGAVAGVAALGASVFELASKGIEATSAEQRFNAIVGDTADQVEKVHVGSLTANLDELGIQFGSTDAEMKNSVASLFQFSQAGGASANQSAEFSNQIVALAARAVSLNPALGNVSDVAQSLGTRIARGGRFAASFGLSLTAAEINAKALGNTGKTTASDLTIQEKATAAAQIATDRYGSSLGEVVAKGAKNAANEQKAFTAELNQSLEELGKPLVAPLFEAIRAAIPDVIAIARPLAEIGVSILPAVAAALSLAAPPLQVVADLLHTIPQPVLAGAAAFVLMNTVLPPLISATLGEAAALGIMGEEAATSAAEVGVASAGLSADVTLMGLSAGQAAVGVGAFFVGWKIGEAIVDSFRTKSLDFTKSLDEEGQSASAAAKATGNDLVPAYHKLVDTIKTNNEQARIAIKLGADSQGATLLQSGAVGDLEAHLRAFRDIAEKNLPTAAALAAGTDKNTALYRGMIGILGSVSKADQDAAAAAAKHKEAGDALLSTIQPIATAEQAAAIAVAGYITGANDAATAVQALATADTDLKASIDLLLGGFLSADQAQVAYTQSIADMNAKLIATNDNFNIFTQEGRDNESAVIGAGQAAESWSSAITKAGGSVADAVVPLQSYHDNLQTVRDGLAAAGADTSFIDGLLIHTQAAIDAVRGKAPDAHAAGKEVGQAGADGAAGTSDAWKRAGAGSGNAFSDGVGGLDPTAALHGHILSGAGSSAAGSHFLDWQIAGQQASAGFGAGITIGQGAAVSAAEEVAQASLFAAKALLGISSPSGAFRDEVGIPIGQGWALGMLDEADTVTAASVTLARAAQGGAQSLIFAGGGGGSKGVPAGAEGGAGGLQPLPAVGVGGGLHVGTIIVQEPVMDPVRTSMAVVDKLLVASYLGDF